MNKIVFRIALVIIAIALSSCKHIFFTEDEKEWINAWCQEDTAYFCDDKGETDTLILSYFSFLQPKTNNPLYLNPSQIELGNDGSNANIGCLLKHSGKVIHLDLYFSANKSSHHDLDVDIDNCDFCYIEDFENLIKNKGSIMLHSNSNEPCEKNIDFLVFEKEVGLSSFSIYNNNFIRCKK